MTNRDWNYTNKYKNKNKNKDYIIKTWDSKSKSWDYDIPGWKPKEYDIPTKDTLLNESYKNWFNDDELQDIKDIIRHKKEITKKINRYDNNKLKLKIYKNQYVFYSALEMIIYDLSLSFNNKDIYFISEKLSNVYNRKPSLERLKYKKTVKISDDIKKISKIDFGIINYWIFEDAIVFKN